MTRDQFISYIKNPELLDQSTIMGLKEIISDYPFFPAARMLYLRNLRNINSYKFESELQKHALFISDRKKLYQLLNVVETSEKEFRLLPFDKTAFEQFFSPHSSVDPIALKLQNSMPFQLYDDKSLKADDSFDLIDKFISENPTIAPVKFVESKQVKQTDEQNENVDDNLITETLVGIYVAQGLYKEALGAYEKLILKFPEKNSYFANQIEKIQKLISKKL